MNEIYQSYVKKDVIAFLQVGKSSVFNNLVKVLASQVGNLVNKSEICSLLENLIFTELVKRNALLNEELFFWRSKGGAEIDFVLSVPGQDSVMPVEVKAGPGRPGLLSKSFHAFLDYFSPGRAIFLNRDLFHIEKVKGTEVYYIPNHWFLLFGMDIIN